MSGKNGVLDMETLRQEDVEVKIADKNGEKDASAAKSSSISAE